MRRLLVFALCLLSLSAWAGGFLKQSTAATIKLGPFLDDTDAKTAETSLTISQADIRLSKAGGDIAQTNNAAGATHDELGYYDVPLDTTDTNTVGRLRVAVSESGALPVWDDFTVLPAQVYDSIIGGTDALQVDTTQVEGGDATDALGVAQTGDAYARIGAPAGASTAADIAAVKADSGAIKTKTDYLPSATAGSAGGVFIAGSNAATSITTALTANVVGNITGNLSGSAGSVSGAVGSVTAPVTAGTVSDKTGYALTAAYDAAKTAAQAGDAMDLVDNSVDAGAIATGAIDADALAADGVTLLQSAVNVISVGGTEVSGPDDLKADLSGLGTVEDIRNDLDTNSTKLSAILADTNELQGDWANGGRLDLLVDSIVAQTDTLEATVAKLRAAVYDSATVSGDTITLSNGATQEVTSSGRVTTEP